MIYLFAGHSRRAVIARSFPLLKDIERRPDANQIGGSPAQHLQAGIQFCVVPQDQIQDDVERRPGDTCQRRAQVFTVHPVRLISFSVAPHVASIGHGDECVQRDVKRRHWSGRLQRLGDARTCPRWSCRARRSHQVA